MAALNFPDTPAVGELYGSTGTVWRWDGARWASTAGASGARGAVAYAQIVTPQGSITAGVNIAGLSASWVANPARTYRTTVMGCASSTVNSDDLNAFITDGAGSQKQFLLYPHLDSSTSTSFTFSVIESGLSGAITRKVMAARAGTGVMTWYAAPTAPSFILVEDITYEAGSGGPVLAPGSFHRRRVDPAALQTIAPNTETTAVFPLDVKQVGTPLISAGGVFTAPVDGIYSLNAWVSFGPGVLSIGMYLRATPQTGTAWNYSSSRNEGHANGYASCELGSTVHFTAGQTAIVVLDIEGSGYNWNQSVGYAPTFSAAHLR